MQSCNLGSTRSLSICYTRSEKVSLIHSSTIENTTGFRLLYLYVITMIYVCFMQRIIPVDEIWETQHNPCIREYRTTPLEREGKVQQLHI